MPLIYQYLVIVVSLRLEIKITRFRSKGAKMSKVTINHPPYQTDLYYPHSWQINQAKIAPIILILQGINTDKCHYFKFAQQLISYDFIVIIPNFINPNNQSINPTVDAILDCVTSFYLEMNNHPLFDCIKDWNDIILIGHSTGGIVGLRTIHNSKEILLSEIDLSLEILAGVFYGTSGFAINNKNIPILLISGGKDQVIPPSETLLTYQKILTLPKAYLNIFDANHTSINNNLRTNKQNKNTPQITELIGTLTALFLLAFINNNREEIDNLLEMSKISSSQLTLTIDF
jgi:predicted dienelactone hydrolase